MTRPPWLYFQEENHFPEGNNRWNQPSILVSRSLCAEQVTGTGPHSKEVSLSACFAPLSTLLSPFQSHWFFSKIVSGRPPLGSVVVCPHWLTSSYPLFWSSSSLWAVIELLASGHGNFDEVILPRASHLLGTQPWKHHRCPLQRSSENFILPS